MSLLALRRFAIYSFFPVVTASHHRGHILSCTTTASKKCWLAVWCFVFAMLKPMFPQAPSFIAAGVVNTASYAQPISPASVVSIFGSNLASTQATAPGKPLPTELAGTSVTVNGTRAPLFYVSPGLINLATPSSLPFSYTDYTSASIVVTTAMGSSAPVQVPVFQTGPAMFTLDESGCGSAVAWNVAANGGLSLNSPANSAAPGDYIAMFGTGLGLATKQPADGSSATGPDWLQSSPSVWIDGNLLSTLPQYTGLAPTLVGVDQVNFRIPMRTREGCAIPVALEGSGVISPTASISIHSERGRCVDPPATSYGQVSLTKTVASGTGNDGETDTFEAIFPAGPGVQPPAQPSLLPPGGYVANALMPLTTSRSCAVPGQTNLSAGPLQLQAGAGVPITIQPGSQNGSVRYSQSLPTGFITAGQYTISALGGPQVGKFSGKLAIPSPVQIQTRLSPGTSISMSQPFTVTWTGGDSGGLVKVSLVSAQGILDFYDYAYADASSGSFTFTPNCSGSPIGSGGSGVICSMSLPTSNNGQVLIEVSPAPGKGASFAATGITGSVQASWTYRYVFGDLVLTLP
jgi:uncharacterized protein (TIGR03437 family)